MAVHPDLILVNAESDDLDGEVEKRADTVSLFTGPEPVLKSCLSEDEQAKFVVSEIQKLLDQGVLLSEIGIFSRTKNLLKPIEKQLNQKKLPYIRLDDQEEIEAAVNTGSMHRAKGLEFKIVFAINVSDDVLPLPQSLKGAVDRQAMEAAIAQEKHLLYVSVTRARDVVYLCWIGQPSHYLTGVQKMIT